MPQTVLFSHCVIRCLVAQQELYLRQNSLRDLCGLEYLTSLEGVDVSANFIS